MVQSCRPGSGGMQLLYIQTDEVANHPKPLGFGFVTP